MSDQRVYTFTYFHLVLEEDGEYYFEGDYSGGYSSRFYTKEAMLAILNDIKYMIQKKDITHLSVYDANQELHPLFDTRDTDQGTVNCLTLYLRNCDQAVFVIPNGEIDKIIGIVSGVKMTASEIMKDPTCAKCIFGSEGLASIVCYCEDKKNLCKKIGDKDE